MISDAEAASANWPFNYTETEWNVIAELVNHNCPNRERFSYRDLLEAANVFLHNTRLLKSSKPGADLWKAAADAMAVARRAVADAINGPPVEPFALPFEPTVAAFLNSDPFARCPTHPLPWLDEWERTARERESFGRIDWKPRAIFYSRVLTCWGDAGGGLRRSRKKPPEKPKEKATISGPTVQYFEAAVKPVMKGDAVGRERIRQLIEIARDLAVANAEYLKREEEQQVPRGH
jgi:hypothetical protein